MKVSKTEFRKMNELFSILLRKRYSLEEIESSLSPVIAEASHRKIFIFLNYLEEVFDDEEGVTLENVQERVARKKVFFHLYLLVYKKV